MRELAKRQLVLRREAAVLAAVEEEGFAVVTFHTFDFAEKDGVIAGGVFGDDVAGEFSEGAVEQRNSGGRPFIRNAEASIFFGRLVAFGEMLGEGSLSCAQNRDAETALRFEKGKQLGFVRDADENQKRIEGDGGEGICGHTVDHAGIAFDGDNGDARGKGACNPAKDYGIERRDGHGAFDSR